MELAVFHASVLSINETRGTICIRQEMLNRLLNALGSSITTLLEYAELGSSQNLRARQSLVALRNQHEEINELVNRVNIERVRLNGGE